MDLFRDNPDLTVLLVVLALGLVGAIGTAMTSSAGQHAVRDPKSGQRTPGPIRKRPAGPVLPDPRPEPETVVLPRPTPAPETVVLPEPTPKPATVVGPGPVLRPHRLVRPAVRARSARRTPPSPTPPPLPLAEMIQPEKVAQAEPLAQPESLTPPGSADLDTALPVTPARFHAADYKNLTRRRLAQVVKNPGDHAGQRVVVFGQVAQIDSDPSIENFLGVCAAARGPLERANPRQGSLPDPVRFSTGSGLTWHPGVWHDELRPAAEQFNGLAEGDVFQAFVHVAGDGCEPLTLVVERIRVYGSGSD